MGMTVKNINVERVSVLPGTLVADTIYVVKADGSSNAVIYVTNNDGAIAATPVTADADVAVDILAATGKTTPVDADLIGIVDSAASNVLKKLTFANLWVWAQAKIVAAYNPREVLTANRTYYVRTDGNDSNTGLANTSGEAFLTIQKAIDVVTALDNGGYNITISVADGTYATGFTANSPFIGGGSVNVIGNTSTPDNCVIGPKNIPFRISDGAKVTIKGFKVISSSRAFQVQNFGNLTLNNINFAATGGNAVACEFYSQTSMLYGSFDVTGSYSAAFLIEGGQMNAYGAAFTLSSTPSWSVAFAYLVGTAYARVTASTYSGTSTGKRYSVNGNSVLSTNGGGATFLPGDVAGTTSTGGQYL